MHNVERPRISTFYEALWKRIALQMSDMPVVLATEKMMPHPLISVGMSRTL